MEAKAAEIQQEQLADTNIDENNINTEIISLLAEEILCKNEFFDLIKSNARG